MTRYELYLLLHVMAAIVWVGAAFTMAFLETRAQRAGSATRVVGLAREAAVLGPRVFLPANVIVLVSAVLLVREGPWGFDTLWIELGLAGFVVSFLMGALFFGPGWSRVGRVIEREGIASPEVPARIRRMLFGSWIDLGVLLAVVFVMTVKPANGETGALAIAAAIPVMCAGIALLLLRADRGWSTDA